jgi:hypothetical protein
MESTSVAVADDESAPLLDERVQGCWRDVLASINARKRMLGAFLEESRFLGVSGSTLVLATDDLHRAVIEENENKKLLAEEVRRAFGQPLELLCGGGPAAQAPPSTSEPMDVQSMIDRAVAWFDGEKVAPAERARPGASQR